LSINHSRGLRSVPRLGAPRHEDTGGDLMDLADAAAFLKATKRAVRGRVSRRQLPYRKLGRRLMFLRSELQRFVTELPGCSYTEAKRNMERSEM
jgi:hypothetical protein